MKIAKTEPSQYEVIENLGLSDRIPYQLINSCADSNMIA